MQEKSVYHFQMNLWKQTENSPSDTNAFVELVKDVERTANETDVTSSVIVHCLCVRVLHHNTIVVLRLNHTFYPLQYVYFMSIFVLQSCNICQRN